ncbi:hypothetical protein ONS95_004171 [Cadophora gregata]|uniref:uncharacterized protein n=1 Tax=Cadophora gregata TaxID=51156 RepID=UPI0026DB83D3|nr:uncharacterized protein ONS95_004171 [Cadophora gregata]KAK0105643.1 hypothetical protein ONS95_004171 [Cadophora gregata]
MTNESKNHALVFGASGVAGWGLVNELLKNYPNEGSFFKVTAVINRHLNFEDTYWPPPSSNRPKFQLVSGVNLLRGTDEEFTEKLRGKVEDMETVTHAFYFGILILRIYTMAVIDIFDSLQTRERPSNRSSSKSWHAFASDRSIEYSLPKFEISRFSKRNKG